MAYSHGSAASQVRGLPRSAAPLRRRVLRGRADLLCGGGRFVFQEQDRSLGEEAERLRQEALVCRDKALCCTGPKQRQLISLAELKERRAADIVARISDASMADSQRSKRNAERIQESEKSTKLHQRAAGAVRVPVDPRSCSNIFDSNF